jgi:prephenate dehydrogenase
MMMGGSEDCGSKSIRLDLMTVRACRNRARAGSRTSASFIAEESRAVYDATMRTVAVLGYGRFGGALGVLLSDAGVPFRAFDPAPGVTVPEAHRAGSIAALVDGARIVVVAVPIPRTREALISLAPHLGPGHLVLDVGSVKMAPMESMREVLGARVPHAGTHPLFGPLSLAIGERPLRAVVCQSPLHPDAAEEARRFYADLGCEVSVQTAEQHDAVMADTHALTFFVAKGLLEAGVEVDVPFAPASFQAIARTIETVRSDAGHLFRTLETDNPYAPAARKRLLEALVRIDAALVTPTPTAPSPSTGRTEDEPAPTADASDIPDLGQRSPALRETREMIDTLDRELLELLVRRAHLARRAAAAKARLGRPIYDAPREKSLLDTRRAWAHDEGLDEEHILDVYRAILQFSRGVQK